MLMLLVSFLLNACKEEEDKTVYTIKGRFIKSCDSPVPVPNRPFQLYYYDSEKVYGKKNKSGVVATGVSDNDGRFSIEYTIKNSMVSDDGLDIQFDAGYYISTFLSNIPHKQNIDVGDIYMDTNYFAIIKIKTSTSFDNDTLYYNIANGDHKGIIGPFSNEQIIDTMSFYRVEGYSSSTTPVRARQISIPFNYGIGNAYWRGKTARYYGSVKAEQCQKYSVIYLDLDTL